MSLLNTKMIELIDNTFHNDILWDVSMASYSTAHVGGMAKALYLAKDKQSLIQIFRFCWHHNLPVLALGAGSNILFGQEGFSGIIVHNQTREISINLNAASAEISAESGVNLGMLARKAALAGISGLEWAVTIPGTIGGAVYGNAGAHGGDIKGNLMMVEILQPDSDPEFWSVEKMNYGYRSSILKESKCKAVILSATFSGKHDEEEKIQAQMRKNSDYRKQTQPPGASLGSIFKNPPGDFAGRLIEAAGLKGKSIGGVMVSPVHANFFVTSPKATSNDYFALINVVKSAVFNQFNINLETEIELIGFEQPLFPDLNSAEEAIQHD